MDSPGDAARPSANGASSLRRVTHRIPRNPLDLLQELALLEPAKSEHLVETSQGRLPEALPSQVAGGAQPGRDLDPVDDLDVVARQVALAAVGQPVAQSTVARRSEDRDRPQGEVFVGCEDHLGAVDPAGVPVADDTVRRHDERKAVGPEPDRVTGLRREVGAGDRLAEQTGVDQARQVVPADALACSDPRGERLVEGQREAVVEDRVVETVV
ncbi:hypothetical protein [Nocardioides sp.]|uniref:hypothetical protein n=1 Tax=Nocardioides sp. TaxID=35761 RepID=UPI00271F1EF4|nr:hypothetical protein [Nocardioides sp.]MDO9456779.1 hypothetical protein [Nocardioides sp.]